MVILELKIMMPAGQQEAMRAEARRLLGPTRARPGCIQCRCLLDSEDQASLTWLEEWETRAHLDRHARSEDFRIILGWLDLSTSAPDFRIHTIEQTTGLEGLAAPGEE